MEAGYILLCCVFILIGMITGMYIEKRKFSHRDVVGSLNIDTGNRGSRYDMFLALEIPLTDVVTRKHVIFKVNLVTRNSHK